MRIRTITVCLLAWVSAVHVVAAEVPGTVIHYCPASSGIYLGSPGIVILPDGRYAAKCDEFGPKSAERQSAVTLVFGSEDKGRTWKHLARVTDMYWATIFVHREALYLLGNHKQYGDIVISQSTDGGRTWSAPGDPKTGRLRTDGQYHCAPVPILIHNGRIWRAMERMGVPDRWGTFEAGVISAPVGADLLDTESWTCTNFLAVPQGHPIRHWLEGNVVLSPDGQVLNILRTGHPGPAEKAVVLSVSSDARTVSLHREHALVDMPGAADKKFTIRHDPVSGKYWALVNPMLPEDRNDARPGSIRNTLALICSADLRQWETRAVLLHHPDVTRHAFQYPDWVFEGEDLIAAVRTAYDDDHGGAHNYHDANYLTFHRIRNFRSAP